MHNVLYGFLKDLLCGKSSVVFGIVVGMELCGGTKECNLTRMFVY